MALEVGTNSYITVVDADAYFADRLDAAAWTSFATDKDKALIAATRAVDRLPLVGTRKEALQALQFPRCYAVGIRPGSTLSEPFNLLTTTSVPKQECEDEVPKAVLDAVCEEALALLQSAGDEQAELRGKLQRQGVTSVKIGSTSETYGATRSASADLLSEEAEQLLRPYLSASGGFG